MILCNVILYGKLLLLLYDRSSATVSDAFKDQTTHRANTLLDDADDIQKQLDREAKDRAKYGGVPSFHYGKYKNRPIWVLHFPAQLPNSGVLKTVTKPVTKLWEPTMRVIKDRREITLDFLGMVPEDLKDWSYEEQSSWYKTYPDCGRRSQSPVNLPYQGFIKAKSPRKLIFGNYHEPPENFYVEDNGRSVTFKGKWRYERQPFIYGGAGHSRRYIFNSITLHWPSEHSVRGLQYPLESQVLHVSAEYKTFEEAVNASAKDSLAFLGVVNLYMFGNYTQEGISYMLKAARKAKHSSRVMIPKPLEYYNPPFKEYACYQGSLTAPPCKESVLWLVRAQALSVSRDIMSSLPIPHLQGPIFSRSVQPLNDRRVYYFKN